MTSGGETPTTGSLGSPLRLRRFSLPKLHVYQVDRINLRYLFVVREGRIRLILAAVLGALAFPGLCAPAVGLMMGEGPQPDGHIGQPPWQMPLAFALMVAGVCGLILCSRAVEILRNVGDPATAVTVVRLASLYPFGASLAIVIAGFMRFRDASAPEGILFMIFGLIIGSLSVEMMRTRRQHFEPERGTTKQ